MYVYIYIYIYTYISGQPLNQRDTILNQLLNINEQMSVNSPCRVNLNAILSLRLRLSAVTPPCSSRVASKVEIPLINDFRLVFEIIDARERTVVAVTALLKSIKYIRGASRTLPVSATTLRGEYVFTHSRGAGTGIRLRVFRLVHPV